MPFVMRKTSFDWNYWIRIKDYNSIINGCIAIRICVCRASRLTNRQQKHFTAGIYMRPSIQNQKQILSIASEYISEVMVMLTE